jgi:DNA mismatch endonuclease Vsr
MQHIRSKDTKPEKMIAQELRHRKIYFVQHVKSIFGIPDFVFRRKKIEVFIDSDFWHGHPKRCVMPKSNIDYWVPKIERNRIRDKEVTARLKNEGWQVVRLWEYEIKKNLERSMDKIFKHLKL